jgi:hypothetical protein
MVRESETASLNMVEICSRCVLFTFLHFLLRGVVACQDLASCGPPLHTASGTPSDEYHFSEVFPYVCEGQDTDP